MVENIYEFVEGEVGEAETSFISEEFLPDCVPAGLYCVIDDFLSEYELRLLEEEQRAKLLQGNQIKANSGQITFSSLPRDLTFLK